MARSDLLLALVRSGAKGDELGFHRATEALIADEQGKRHQVLASQLAEALSARQTRPTVTALARTEATRGLWHEQLPERSLGELVLPGQVRSALTELIEEHARRDLLRSHGVEPRHRLMLVGPPGGGKTTIAEALATELAVPLLSVRYEGLIGSYLGETSSRMEALFAGVRTRPCVLFFDEFDTVAKERGDVHETGEIKRVVSSLLLQIDRLPSHVVVVAATNHPELLDRAAWRRMQIRVELPSPSRSAAIEWLDGWSTRNRVSFGITSRTIAEKLAGLSFAEIEQFALDVQRRLILSGPDSDARSVTTAVLRHWSGRVRPER